LNAPHLPNIAAIADTSRGKLSAQLDLRHATGRQALDLLLGQTRVFVQGYRPGALTALGYGARALAQRWPGIIYVSLSAYGDEGPWSARRGFDSLVQTATGFNHAEALAAGGGEPRALPAQMLDYATGFLMAFATAVALRRQMLEGGSWHVRLSLAQTGHWLRQLGRVAGAFGLADAQREPYLESSASGFGQLLAVRHSAQLSRTPASWTRLSMPPGTHLPVWP